MVFDYSEIQKDFDRVIKHSQGYDEVHTDILFDKWYKNKSWFIKGFNGQLIYEYPERVQFTLPEDEKMRRVSDFIDELRGYNYNLSRFVVRASGDFYSNIVSEDMIIDGIKVPKGMKITRAFKLFEKDKELLDKWQTKMSMLLQEDCVSGTFCISVHPLDFLSLSENAYNWRSCHSLDGDYRTGNISYMLDKSTVICYLKSDNDAILPRFPSDLLWNNKKWRMLLFLSDNKRGMFAGRQYPFTSDCGLDIAQKAIKACENVNPFRWTQWTNKQITYFSYGGWTNYFSKPYVGIYGEILKLDSLIVESRNPLHFNDLLRSSYYTPYYCWSDDFYIYRRAIDDCDKFHIGSDVPCLFCGEENVQIEGSMLCNEHELEFGTCDNEDIFCYCDYCGARIFVDDAYRLRDGEWVCEDCCDTHCVQCDCCEEYVWSSQAYYDEEKDRVTCDECCGEDWD